MEPQPQPLANFSNLQASWDNLTANRLAGNQRAILDLWEANLYGATQKLVQVLLTEHNPSIPFLALPHKRGKVGSFHR
jgi:hypothetical protein